ncbi:tetratricopeptide repeat protein [Croceibacterium mercuriale]|uniref:tetratricopeptide repeat protein n=1 Tax=Croceibacterium mercuriale TaxID=1572751 RepID=UPI00068BA5F9|nr:tetratricopeptide repeat protein [Croceibacterium mercuriale]
MAHLVSVTTLLPSVTTAQEAAAPLPPSTSDQVVVTGQVLPPAEAPRSATCEALVRDGHFQALLTTARGGDLLGPQILQSTRSPRNPDWAAAPLSPPGSPLPELGEQRFGLSPTDARGLQGGLVSGPDGAPLSIETVANNRDQAIALCRKIYQRGDFAPTYTATQIQLEGELVSGPGGISSPGRNMLVRRDTTLPMAFALFDLGRYEESLDWFRRAERRLQPAEGGEEAALFIGKINLLAPGEWADREEGIRWLKRTATSPYSPIDDMPRFDPDRPGWNTAVGEAAIILGNLYRSGFGDIPADPEEARRWFDKALDVGHLPAAQILGDMCFAGEGGRRDVPRAVRFYRRVAEFGLPTAQYALGQILEFGDDRVEPDQPEALRWYREAARASHPGAMFALAVAYDRGAGVPVDRVLATGFYKEAALQGHAGAMAALGTSFYTGDGVAQDHPVARQWFAQAAGLGDVDGMVNLAVMAARGEGGAPDRVAAWRLLHSASQRRHERAPTVLAALEAQMSPEERRAAASAMH